MLESQYLVLSSEGQRIQASWVLPHTFIPRLSTASALQEPVSCMMSRADMTGRSDHERWKKKKLWQQKRHPGGEDRFATACLASGCSLESSGKCSIDGVPISNPRALPGHGPGTGTLTLAWPDTYGGDQQHRRRELD